MDTKELGDLGESLACEYLVKKGYKIVGRNYRINFGEIDIIARKKFSFFARRDKTVHFVEVKTIIGGGESFFPEEKVDHKKRRKLIGLCQIWLQKNRFPQDIPYQIDVIGVLLDPNSGKSKIEYFPSSVENL